ncbi:hypothetical protein HDU85_001617 [Gaertneriomyces sp. JEL0708]|nr:hypothetical protein HDU85_001617 [Gaertneriomyces sp. JEL0708]
MAALSSEVLNQLALVLASLSSTDNAVRSGAEENLNSLLIGQSAVLLCSLANLTRNSGDEHLRQFAAILLRRLALKQAHDAPKDQNVTYYISIGNEARVYVQNELMESLKNEVRPTVRRKVADTVAELAKHMLHKGSTWDDLLHIIFDCARSPTPEHRITSFQIIAQVPGIITDADPTMMKRSFLTALQDQSLEVRVEAMSAAVQYMAELEPKQLALFNDFLPQMLAILPALSDNEEQLEKCLGYLIELGDIHPKLFRPVMPDLMQFTLQIMKNEELEDTTRQTALEVNLTLAEAAPGLFRKNPQGIAVLIPTLTEWMTHLEDDESWYTTDSVEDDDNDADDIVGGEALDRLARALGGKAVLPIAFGMIPTMLSDAQNWAKRHGALMTISAIAEGCAKIMEAELQQILALIVPHLRDPHPRVRWAACNAVGQMSTDFTPTIQTKHADIFLTNLVPVMDDAQFPRVQAHAAAALVNFSTEVPKENIAPYLDGIFQRCLALLNTGKTYVQEQALTTIATCADAAGDRFVQYYPSIMPILVNVLKQATAKEFRLLRGKAVECATLIALAVGKDVFANDAPEFIQILQQMQESVTDPDDPVGSYLLAAWARVGKVLGPDFVPYLPMVLPPLLQSAALKPDVSMIDEEDDDEVAEKYGEDWELLLIDGQRIGIKTSVLEEKCTAVEMLICYARELGAGFAPYVEQVMNIAVPLIKFYFHEGVRHAAAGLIPLLFEALVKAAVARTQILPTYHNVFTKLVECSSDEVDTAFLAQLYTTMQELLDVMGPDSVPIELRNLWAEAVNSQLQAYWDRGVERDAARKEADFDPEDEELLQSAEEGDDAFLAELSTAFHSMVKNHREGFVPQFEKMAPVIFKFFESTTLSCRHFALCALDDIIEFIGPASFPYHGHFWGHIHRSLIDASPEIRQAAAYGVGVAAQFGGPNYAPLAVEALQNLFAMINAPGARLEGVLATENAVSAVGKILHFVSAPYDHDSVLEAWINALPILQDSDEAPHTYSYLLSLLETPNAVVQRNVVQVAVVLAKALANSEELFEHEEMKRKVLEGLQRVIGGVGEEGKAGVWRGLSEVERRVLGERGFI